MDEPISQRSRIGRQQHNDEPHPRGNEEERTAEVLGVILHADSDQNNDEQMNDRQCDDDALNDVRGESEE